MIVKCSVEEIDYEDDEYRGSGVQALCPRCSHSTESYGTSTASIRRCLVMLREECPRSEKNYYISDDGSHDDGEDL
jgi:hypothetical protein